jgi:hypothetical protein
MNAFYLDLLSGKTTLQDVTDDQLKVLSKCWVDGKELLPNAEIWTAVPLEQRRREVASATKRVKEAMARRKAVNSDFFGVKP